MARWRGLRVEWPAVAVATALLIVVVLFGHYLENRQQLADQRVEKQRRAICAILANIPGEVPAEIKTARRAFARDGHPSDCQPIPRRRAAPRPTPTVTVSTSPVPRPEATRTVRPSPAPTVTVTRTPVPRPTPSHRPTPRPSPTCLPIVNHCLQPLRGPS